MMTLHVSQIVEAVHGTYLGDDDAARREVSGLVWDSRNIIPGNVFLAMPGERVDGNDYIAQAANAGAGAIITTRTPSDALRAVCGEFSCPLIVVQDGTLALTQLASVWRGHLHSIVIGVTGSTGKTSTKDFLRAVLSRRFNTSATVGNRNNEFGIPATILAADEETEVLIVEMGMRGLGQLEEICQTVRPGIGIVTNVGVSHMELLGSRENIARAKGELLASLPQTGTAFVNADDDMTPFLLEQAGMNASERTVLTFGFAGDAFARADAVTYDAEGCAHFDLCFEDSDRVKVQLSMPGRHNVYNALAAAAVGRYLGMMSEDIALGLAEATGSGMRMEIEHGPRGITVVNDAYNANPDSMRASLDTLASMEAPGRRIAVLGDMGELGEQEYHMHVEVGSYAATSHLDLLVCVGALSRGIAAGALESGMPGDRIVACETVEDAIAYLADNVRDNDLILVKASRFMGMERIVRRIVE